MTTVKDMKEEDLAKVAAELDLDITVVKALIAKADSSSPLNGDTQLKEAYKTILDAAKATNPGGANASKREAVDVEDLEDDEEEGMKVGKKKTKIVKKEDSFTEEELRTTVMELSEDEFHSLKSIVNEVDELPTTSKLQAQLDAMQDLLSEQSRALKSVMQVVVNGNASDAAGDAVGDTAGDDVQEAIKSLIANLPKSQSATFASDVITDGNVDGDQQILASLKSIEAKLDATPITGNKNGIYDLFTSKAK